MKYCALWIPLIIHRVNWNWIFNWNFKQIKIEIDQRLKKKSNMSQLLATTLVMMEKDKEILKLKAELARQQNSAKQQKEFQEQIEQMIVQKEAERSALKSQVQQLKTRFLQKYYPNMFINGPSGDQNILAIESTDTLDNYIDNIDPTFDNRT